MIEQETITSPFENEIAESVEITRFGDILLTSTAFGPRINNEELLQKVSTASGSTGSITEQDAVKFIEGTGLTMRRQSFSAETPVEEVVKVCAKIGAAQVRGIMVKSGWESIDLLIDTSASLPQVVGEQMIHEAGLDPIHVNRRSYRTACSGAISALVDCLQEPELKDKKIVICALEPLSMHITQDHYRTLEGLGIPAIFGDDYAAIGFCPKNFEQVAPRSLVAFDGGTIRFKTHYDFPKHDPEDVPVHYIVGSRGDEIFSASDEGIFIAIQEPNKLPSEMNGRATARYFIKRTIEVIKDTLDEAGFESEKPIQAFGHQPSRDINQGFQNLLRKKVPQISIPDFLLGSIERSNSSSATTPIIWQHLAKEGVIDPNKPFLPYAPGIGSVISASVIKHK